MERRAFLAAAASAGLAAMRPDRAWGLPLSRGGRAAAGPEWRPSGMLLRNLPRLLELASVPGVAIAVVEQGEISTHAVGRRSAEAGGPVNGDTLFEAASLGKPLVAYGALRLADKRLLDLDRPLYAYVRTAEADNPAMRSVTARHVLTQTTGLPNWRRSAGPLQPVSRPGTAFSYSGEGFFQLQRVIEKVTGVPFARWMQAEVLVPLGMKQSCYAWRPAFDARMAAGHDAQGEPREMYAAIGRASEPIAERWKKPMLDWRTEDALRAVPLVNPQWPALPLYAMPNAACSFLTTTQDYARFLERMVARAPAAGLELSEPLLESMSRPAVKLNSALSWGTGWGIQRDEYGEVLWHWGANMSFRNFVIADRANGRAVAVLTNGENGPRVYERVIAGITGHDHPSFLWI